ncbi:serine protease snake [Anabrus simplex]|uniref:serine protease snake n=1 Tax=Anabrus simplex TaxID=316456 RepID=UPI0035A2A4FF
MGTLPYVAFFTWLGFSRAIYFNATDFREEYICDVGGRTLGICKDPGQCIAGSTASASCGIESIWNVCCPFTTDKRLPAPIGEKSRQKCRDYAESLLEPRCPGFRPFNGSNEALPTEFPHMAALGYKLTFGSRELRWLCAGSLISELFVLTEHVCATGARGTGRPRRVRLGDVDLNSPEGDEYAQEIPIQKIHRLWKSKKAESYHNVALLRLARAATFTPAVRPACLHTESIIPASGGVVAGWGKTSNEYGVQEKKVLRKADLKFISRPYCEEIYEKDDFLGYVNNGLLIRNVYLCAGELDGSKDTCTGDGGAPLMVKLASPYCTYSIVGVLAFGSVPCGQPLKASVFTRIYNYIPWIEFIVWADEDK